VPPSTPSTKQLTLSLDKEAQPAEFVAGAAVTYTFAVTNVGNVTLNGISVSDPLIDPVTCDRAGLAPSESALCTGTYVLTQADVDAGEVINVASASGVDPQGDPVTGVDSETTRFEAMPALVLDKQEPAGLLEVDETLTWTFIVTNTGTVSLFDLVVDDSETTPVVCDTTTLAPAEFATCTSTSVLTQQMLDSGEITNTATASGVDPFGTVVSDVDDVVQSLPSNPSLTLQKTADAVLPVTGDQILYELLVTNDGNLTAANVAVTDPLAPVVCPLTGLAPGESMTCTAVLDVTQEMVDSGEIANTATVTGSTPGGEPLISSSTEIVTPDQTAAISLDKQAQGSIRAGEQLGYIFVVTNTGVVTLSGVAIDDAKVPTLTCPTDVLAPGESMTCRASYEVTVDDASNGFVRNDATVAGVSPLGAVVDDVDSVRTLVAPPPPSGPEYPGPFTQQPPHKPGLLTPPMIVAVPPEPPQRPLAQTGTQVSGQMAASFAFLLIGGMLLIAGRRQRRID